MADKMVMIEIDGRRLSAQAESSILDAARDAGIGIPTLCHLPGRECKPVCRVCSVAITGWNSLAPACATAVQDGMVITTQDAQIERMRRTLMSLALEEHGVCTDPECDVERLARQLGAAPAVHALLAQEAGKAVASDYMLFDSSQCIHCDRCIRACELTILSRAGRGAGVSMVFGDNQAIDASGCIACGDCLAVCPSGALDKEHT